MDLSKYGTEIKTLGSGTFGTVKFYRTDTDSYAIKFIDRYHGINFSAILEAAIMSNLNHPNVVKLLDFDLAGDKAILVMPMANSDLSRYTPTDLTEINNTAYQMIRSVAYIHSRGVLHKDIKPQNFLYSKLGTQQVLWLADFGISKFNYCHKGYGEDIAFTLWYRSPEITVGNIYNESGDIWALGTTIIEMITNEPLFQSMSESQHLRNIFNILGMPPDEIYDELSKGPMFDRQINVKLDNAMYINRGKRIFEELRLSVPDTLHNILMKMLSYRPSDRPTAFDLMTDPYFAETADNYNRTLPPDTPELELSCIAKLDFRSIELTAIPGNDDVARKVDLVADIAGRLNLTHETVSLVFHLLDMLPGSGMNSFVRFWTVVKIASSIYGEVQTLQSMQEIYDRPWPKDLMDEMIAYESRIIDSVVPHLSVSTSYMYMVEYARQFDIDNEERMKYSRAALWIILMSNLRFRTDSSTIAIAALYTANRLKFTVPEALQSYVMLVLSDVDTGFQFYKANLGNSQFKPILDQMT